MRALDIIAAEHVSLWRVSNALGVLGARIAKAPDETDIHTIALIADYLDGFAERLHHPKENDYLFARVRMRSNEAGEVIDKLARDHDATPLQVLRIGELARSSGAWSEEKIADLREEIDSFRARLTEHMSLEEEVVFPLARAVLTPADWEAVDGAFAAHIDPFGDPAAEGDIVVLRSRVAQLLPAPEGFGGHSEKVAVAVRSPRSDGAEALLEISGLVCRYGRIEALHGVSIVVRPGELVALVGANGAGKTTLLRAISGIAPIAGGTMRFGGRDMTRLSPDARVRAGVAQVPEGRQVFAPMSIEDNLLMGAYTRPAHEIDAAKEEVYDLFPILRERRKSPAGALSGGQQQMLALGRAMMARPKLLLLDEPSMGLAPLIVEEIFRIVKMFKQAGMTILLVEQNARAALTLADHAYVLETGVVTLEGPGPELLAMDEVRRAYLGM